MRITGLTLAANMKVLPEYVRAGHAKFRVGEIVHSLFRGVLKNLLTH
jgi:hypothetical protein